MAPLAFLDVAYAPDAAGVACVLADTWEAEYALATATTRIASAPAPYQPGEFYRRELPLLLSLLKEVDPLPRILVIDGYVWLADRDPGLGAHLFEAYGGTIPVVGVAKSRYRGDTRSAQVLRGGSRRPLHVTAAGVDLSQTARWIASMHGPHRIPTLLQQVDSLSRHALVLPKHA
jgi:deoxyribonuclease V